MSEEGGEPVKNGDVAALPESEQQSEVKCPEVDFSPYDEHGRPKPFIAICPAKPPDLPKEPTAVEEAPKNGPTKDDSSTAAPAESKTEELVKEEPKTNGTKDHQKQDDAKEQPKTNGTSEQAKEEPKSPASSAEQKSMNKCFSDQFKLFSKFGDCKSDGRLLSLSQSDKWMKQAKVIDGKHITTTDTGIHFKKLKSIKVSETDYKKFLEELAKSKKMNCDDIKKKMMNCGAPGLTSTAAGAKTPSAFERLTDTSKYTGCHKQRFDETGKGRGIAGRKDMKDNSGYVSGYTNKNTYDKKNPTK